MLKSFFIEGYKRARSHAVTTRGKYKSKAELNGFGIVHIVNGSWFTVQIFSCSGFGLTNFKGGILDSKIKILS